MKPISRGSVYGINETFGVGDLADKVGQNMLNGEPSSSLNIRDRGTLRSGDRYAVGEVANRKEERNEVPVIADDGDISLTHEDQVARKYSVWAVVPGEFVVAWDEWATKQLYFNFPMDEPTDQNIWLNGLYRETDFIQLTSIGFRGRQDSAEKGTVHGAGNVTNDEALGTELNADSSYLNELRYAHDWDGHVVEGYIAASGYVELYEPSDFGTEHFLEYVQDFVYPHTESAEDDGGGA